MASPLSRIGSFFGLGRSNGTLNGQPHRSALDEYEPSRGDLTSEKARTLGANMPAFLPWLDSQQNAEETAVMRMGYRRMLADPTVKGSFLGKLLGVMALDLKIHPASDHARHKEHAEFIEWNLTKRLNGGVIGLVWNLIAHGCIDGMSVNEKVWTVQDGDTNQRWHLKRVLRDLKPKDVNSDVVLKVDKFRNVYGVMGLRYNSGELWSPRDFVIWMNLPLFNSPGGMSDFRAAYGRYWLLDTVTKLRGRGATKRAEPYIYGEYPDATKQSKVQEILSQIRSENWGAVPAGVKLQVMELAGASAQYFKDFRDDCREEIIYSIQLATLQSLTGGAGTMRGSSAVHKDTADLAKWLLAEQTCQLLNHHETGLIQDMLVGVGNYADVGELPHATLTGVDDAELGESMKIDQGLSAIGCVLSTKETMERYGRKQPEDSEDELRPTPQAGPTGDGSGWFTGLDDLLGRTPPDHDQRPEGFVDDATGIYTQRPKRLLFSETGSDGPSTITSIVRDIRTILHLRPKAAEIKALAERLKGLSGSDLAAIKEQLGIKAGGTLAEMADKIAKQVKAPRLDAARIQIKHLLGMGNTEAVLPLVKKLSAADQEKLAEFHGMDVGNFLFQPKEIAAHIVHRAGKQ